MTTSCDRAFNAGTERITGKEDQASFGPLRAALLQHLSPLGYIDCTPYHLLLGYTVDVVEVKDPKGSWGHGRDEGVYMYRSRGGFINGDDSSYLEPTESVN